MVACAFDEAPDSAAFEALRQEFLERYQEHCAVFTRPFEGIEALLGDIEQARLLWGVLPTSHCVTQSRSCSA